MKNNYREFDLIKKDQAGFLRYIFHVKSGDKYLNFLLDSGSPSSIILEESFIECNHFKKTRAKFYYWIYSHLPGKGHKSVIIFSALDRNGTEITFNKLYFTIIPKEDIENTGSLKQEKIDGLLGMDFLKRCSLLFIDKILVWYP